ncbi:hypothetical protein H0H87_005031 [Tephrocybe sp. NHM501043]|nr:hypothetical protein H0H87_005031 [Tephrocybe sp. NHM501043]
MFTGIRAGPLPPQPHLHRRASALSSDQIESLVPFTQFSRAAYCEPEKIQDWKKSVLTDLEVLRGPLDSALFPGVPEGVSVHTGFRDQHAINSKVITTEVQRLLDEKVANKVITTGHSLGGALAMLSGLSLRLQLPEDVSVSSTTFGTPRIGDQQFADFFDSKVSAFYIWSIFPVFV